MPPNQRRLVAPYFGRTLATWLVGGALLAGCNEASSLSEGDARRDVSTVDTSPDLPLAVEPLPTGSPCEERSKCGDGSSCNLDWPDGYCTIRPCRGGITRCPGDGTCDIVEGPRTCVDACESSADCRDGYHCVPTEAERLACLPTEPIGPPTAGGPDDRLGCWGVPDGGFVAFPVDPEFMITSVVVLAPRGSVRPYALVLNDGSAFELTDVRDAGYGVARNISQSTVPHLPHEPDLPYSHIVYSTADAEEVCVTRHERQEVGYTVQLNIYVNAADGFTADRAESNATLTTMLRELRRLYSGVELEFVVDYRDLSDDLAAEFRIVSNDSDAQRLALLAPGAPEVETLSLNVFLVESLERTNFVLLGLSLGIPGPAGVHQTAASGILLSAEYSDGRQMGQTLGHELGHYLGLFHTTEQSGRHFYPLLDTPQCSADSDEWAFGTCPDRTNLMWPILTSQSLRLTDDQGWVMRRHPLVLPNGLVGGD